MEKELHIALVQSSLIWESPQGNRRKFSDKLASISSEVDLVILPEMFTTGFTMAPENIANSEGVKTVEWMRMEAKKGNFALVGSIPFHDKDAFTNRLFFVEPSGETSFYDKRHTFTLAGEDKVYKAGFEKLMVDYKGFKICPLICYDLRFPVWSRNIEDYDLLIYVANWPRPRITAWDVLLKARAIENMAYCIGTNRVGKDDAGFEYCGHSAVYDCLGEQMTFSDEETMLYATLSKDHIESTRNKLKFLNDRDGFNLLT